MFLKGFTTGEDIEVQEVPINSNINSQPTILEEYPEYNFEISSSFFSEKINRMKRIRTVLTVISIASAVLSIIAFIIIGHWHPDGYIAFNIFGISIVVGLISYVSLTQTISKYTKLILSAYYIQNIDACLKEHFNYSIIVSTDRKWGIANIKNLQIIIPPAFDYIEWKEKNRYVFVYKNNEKEIRDINNNIFL